MKAKKNVYIIPSTESEVTSMQFPDDVVLREVEKKFKEQFEKRFPSASFDFKKVGSSESLNWYVGIACEYQDSVRAEIVVPEIYAKAWSALKDKGEGKYCLVVLPAGKMTYFVIGKNEPLIINEFDFDISAISNEQLAKSSDITQQDFRRITFPAAEIEKTLIAGDMPSEKLEAFKYPEVVKVNPENYSGSLNLNSRFSMRKKKTWNNLLLQIPIIGREIVSLAIVFLLYFSWLFPAKSAVLYVMHLFDENNTELQANIEELRESKAKVQDVINESKKQQDLIKQWESVAKNIKKIDLVALSNTILKNSNVMDVRMDESSISITLTANSSGEVDSYMKMLIDSGFFKGFSAPERKKGTSIYMLRGEVNEG